MDSVCLRPDALLQHPPSYLGFTYLGRGVSLQGCSSKAQPLLLTLDKGYLLTTTPPDLERGIAPLGPPAPAQPPVLERGVTPPGRHPWPPVWGSSSTVAWAAAAAHKRKLCKLIPYNKSLFVFIHFPLVLFLWRTLNNTETLSFSSNSDIGSLCLYISHPCICLYAFLCWAPNFPFSWFTYFIKAHSLVTSLIKRIHEK